MNAVPQTQTKKSAKAVTKRGAAIFLLDRIHSKRSAANGAIGVGLKRQRCGGVICNGDTADDAPLVVTFAVKETGFAEVTESDAGEREQVAAVGAPVHAIEMFPVKPVPGVSCRLYWAV